jgi:hypothetical protein
MEQPLRHDDEIVGFYAATTGDTVAAPATAGPLDAVLMFLGVRYRTPA